MSPRLSNRKELIDRVDAKRHELQAQLAELRADGRKKAREEIDRLQGRIKEIETALSDAMKDASEAASKKLNDLLS